MRHLDNPLEAFENDTIDQLLQYKEGQHFDRKRNRKQRQVAELLVGFANANQEGGLILLGVEDDGTVFGLKNAYGDNYRNEIARCSEHISHVSPQYRFLPTKNSKGEDDEIALIFVPYSAQVASTPDGDVYLRIGDQNKKLQPEDIVRLRQERGQDIPFSNLLSGVLVKSAQLHSSVINDYLQRTAGQTQSIGLERVLLNRHLAIEIRGEMYLTKAGLLLLAQDPRYEIPGAFVRFLKFEGREALYGENLNVVQDETFFGPIPLVAQRLRDYIPTQLRQFRYLGGDKKFIVDPELPEDAWFEVIINALVHRAYHMVNDSIVIRLFEDRLEVISPGSYPAGVNPSEFPSGDVSRPRNVTIMNFMRDIQYVQMYHEGTKRIFAAMEAAGLPAPKYSPPSDTHVKVTLYNDIDRRKSTHEETIAPISNLFRLEIQKTDSSQPSTDEDNEPLTFLELRSALEKGIRDKGWAVSSFTGNVAIDLKKPPLVSEGDLVSIHSAFRFSIQQISGQYYLALDYKIEVRNRATLAKIRAIAPQVLLNRLGRGFARLEGKWLPCYIQKVSSSDQIALVEFHSDDESSEREQTRVNFSDVLPDLNSTQFSELLRSRNTGLDLYREKSRLSNLPPSIRLEQIREINNELRSRVFPLEVRDYQVHLSSEPVRMTPPNFYPSHSLREPSISFSREQLGKEVARGLTSFGAYERPTANIPVILMSPSDKMPQLEQLVTSLQKGSKRFSGFRNTFGTGLEVIGKYNANFDDYRRTCEHIVPDLAKSPLPIMVAYMPDQGGEWSRANYSSPYYQVKHYLLENGVASQGVDQETLGNLEWKDLNLALDIFAKTGHIPWVLDEGLPLADIFIGLSYSSIRVNSKLERIIAYVCVFDNFGRWQYYMGNTEPVPFDERDARLADLIAEAVEKYSKTATVSHIHIHHGHKLKFETRQKIAERVQQNVPNVNVSLLYINDDNPIRLFSQVREDQSQVERGTFVRVGDSFKFFLATTGKSELQSLHKGTPVIMQANLSYFGTNRPKDMAMYAQHVLSLTRLNWASSRSYSSQPITLLYSSKVARYMNIFIQAYGSFSLHPSLVSTPWFL